MKKFGIYVAISLIVIGCRSSVKVHKEEIYSRHLQERIALTVFSTPVKNKSDVQLLLVNGMLSNKNLWEQKLDSLFQSKNISPAVVVYIHSKSINELTERTIEKYYAFLDNELIPFIRKQTAVRKFKSISIAGSNNGGELAVGFAWENADKVRKVASLSSFSDSNSIILQQIESSRKRPAISIAMYESYGKNITDSSKMIKILSKKKSVKDNLVYINEMNKNNSDAWDKYLNDVLLFTLGD